LAANCFKTIFILKHTKRSDNFTTAFTISLLVVKLATKKLSRQRSRDNTADRM